MSGSETENPGAPFKTTREKLGLSLHDVSIATKINPRILKALEEGDKSGLPPNSFARGFIRSYAAYLKIESKPILDAFNLNEVAPVIAQPKPTEEISNSAAEIPNVKPRERDARRDVPNDPTIKSKLYISAALFVLVIIIFGIKQVFDKYAQERVIAPLPTQQKPIEPAPTEDKPVVAKEDAPSEPVSSVIGNTKADDSKKDAKTEEVKSEVAKPANTPVSAPTANTPATTAVTAATPATTKTTSVSPTTSTPTPATPTAQPKAPVTATPTVGTTPTTPPTTTKSEQKVTEPTKPAEPVKAIEKPQEIIVEALDKVEISVSVDGGEFTKYSLSPEGIHTIKAKKSVQLEVQDGGMVNIIHNGKEKGVPGDLGKPVKLKYP